MCIAIQTCCQARYYHLPCTHLSSALCLSLCVVLLPRFRDGCTHVLALCSRPYTTGPAWGKYLSRALHNAIKYWLLNPPYMREAWRVEPMHSTHKGQHLDDLLLQLLLQGRALELDAAFDGPSSSRSPGLSPSSSTDGGDTQTALSSADNGVLEGVLGGHVFPLFPGAAASFAPVCTDVPTLQAGRQEGYRSARKLVTAIEALDRSAGGRVSAASAAAAAL